MILVPAAFSRLTLAHGRAAPPGRVSKRPRVRPRSGRTRRLACHHEDTNSRRCAAIAAPAARRLVDRPRVPRLRADLRPPPDLNLCDGDPPQPRRLWFEQCLIWEASDPYLYGRTTPDGRAIFGGEDEDFVDEGARDALLAEKVKAIGRKAKRLFPDLDIAPDFAWTGTFGAQRQRPPWDRAVPATPAARAVLGYGGDGIIYSRIAAGMIRTVLAGRTDPDAISTPSPEPAPHSAGWRGPD